MVIVSIFFVGISNKTTKYLMKLLDGLLFFGLFILLPTIYYFNVVKKTGLEGDHAIFSYIVTGGVCVGIFFTFVLTLRKHSLFTKLLIGVVYFFVMFLITILFFIY